MRNAVVVDVVRTPMGKGKSTGALADVHAVELLAQTLSALVERNGVDPETVDDVIVGCVGQVRDQAATPGRQAWLAAGFPVSVPSTTVERRCGSGQQAIDFAVQGIQSGAYDIAIASGVESMSRVPMGLHRMDADPLGHRVHERFPNIVPQGVAAEFVSHKYGLSRLQLDELSVESHLRAAAATDSGVLRSQIVPVTTPDGTTVTADETIRPGSSVEKLGGLSAVFGTPELSEKYPLIDWKVTAGNSSQITDGAGAVLVTSEETAERMGWTPRARVVSTAVVGDDPELMLTGVIPATRRALDRAGMTIGQIDKVEVNEAFASVPLAWAAEFGYPAKQLNSLGGAIALGHPLGASGIRLFGSLLASLEADDCRFGLQTVCEAGGMANAMVVERL